MSNFGQLSPISSCDASSSDQEPNNQINLKQQDNNNMSSSGNHHEQQQQSTLFMNQLNGASLSDDDDAESGSEMDCMIREARNQNQAASTLQARNVAQQQGSERSATRLNSTSSLLSSASASRSNSNATASTVSAPSTSGGNGGGASNLATRYTNLMLGPNGAKLANNVDCANDVANQQRAINNNNGAGSGKQFALSNQVKLALKGLCHRLSAVPKSLALALLLLIIIAAFVINEFKFVFMQPQDTSLNLNSKLGDLHSAQHEQQQVEIEHTLHRANKQLQAATSGGNDDETASSINMPHLTLANVRLSPQGPLTAQSGTAAANSGTAAANSGTGTAAGAQPAHRPGRYLRSRLRSARAEPVGLNARLQLVAKQLLLGNGASFFASAQPQKHPMGVAAELHSDNRQHHINQLGEGGQQPVVAHLLASPALELQPGDADYLAAASAGHLDSVEPAAAESLGEKIEDVKSVGDSQELVESSVSSGGDGGEFDELQTNQDAADGLMVMDPEHPRLNAKQQMRRLGKQPQQRTALVADKHGRHLTDTEKSRAMVVAAMIAGHPAQKTIREVMTRRRHKHDDKEDEQELDQELNDQQANRLRRHHEQQQQHVQSGNEQEQQQQQHLEENEAHERYDFDPAYDLLAASDAKQQLLEEIFTSGKVSQAERLNYMKKPANQNQHTNKTRHKVHSIRPHRTGNERYDVPQLECNHSDETFDQYACHKPDPDGQIWCLEDKYFCDGYFDCPYGEDEDLQTCMFYKLFMSHIDILTNTLLSWSRKQQQQQQLPPTSSHDSIK